MGGLTPAQRRRRLAAELARWQRRASTAPEAGQRAAADREVERLTRALTELEESQRPPGANAVQARAGVGAHEGPEHA